MNAVHLDYRRIARFLDGFATRDGMKVIAILLALMLIAASVMAGIYAIAAMTVSSVTTGFATTQLASHERIAEFASALKRASAEKKAARAQCDLLTGSGKQLCTAKARAEEKRTKAEARALYNARSRPVIDAGLAAPLNIASEMPSGIVPEVVTSRSH
jgi:hypothetical protein